MTAPSAAVARRMPGTGQGGCAIGLPCDVPAEMSDTEFRLTIALGRAAYNKVHDNRLPALQACASKLRPHHFPRAPNVPASPAQGLALC